MQVMQISDACKSTATMCSSLASMIYPDTRGHLDTAPDFITPDFLYFYKEKHGISTENVTKLHQSKQGILVCFQLVVLFKIIDS